MYTEDERHSWLYVKGGYICVNCSKGFQESETDEKTIESCFRYCPFCGIDKSDKNGKPRIVTFAYKGVEE